VLLLIGSVAVACLVPCPKSRKEAFSMTSYCSNLHAGCASTRQVVMRYAMSGHGTNKGRLFGTPDSSNFRSRVRLTICKICVVRIPLLANSNEFVTP
jgi:hypothetical protein